MVEIGRDGAEVVVDDEDGLALGAEVAEQSEDDGLGGGVDAGHRLVHEVGVGTLGQGTGQEGALLLTAGKLADLAVGQAEPGRRGRGTREPIRDRSARDGGTSRAGQRFPSARHRAR